MEYKRITVGRLLLDTENPRHEPVVAQREAILALIAVERQKLVVLATDIRDNGLSPIDRMLVIKDGRNFTVVEGNRRLAAIRLLENPGLADGTPISAQIRRVASDASSSDEVDCAIAPSRDEAAHWMELRHRGQAGGAGVVPWNTLAANRFSHKPGSQASKAIAFLDAVGNGFPKNDVIPDLIADVAATRLTTLGRLVADPNFKSAIGLVEQDGHMLFRFPASAIETVLEHVLGDLASDVTVSQLKSKEQRTTYLQTVPKPHSKQRLADPRALSDTPAARSRPARRARRRSPKVEKPFQDLDLSQLGSKTEAVLREFRQINVDKIPNAAALLTRAILELSVDGFISEMGLSDKGELKKRIRTCLTQIDPTHKAAEFTGVRKGLEDGNSLFAVATLHAFVHSPYYRADGTTVRSIASNLQPFLQAMNDSV